MCDFDDDFDDDYDENDDGDICPHCQNEGRVPAPDYDAIRGINYHACQHCEHGLRWPEYL